MIIAIQNVGVAIPIEQKPSIILSGHLPLLLPAINPNTMARKYAAGLVIYWTVSNIFSIGQQLITNKIVEDEIEEVEVKDK